MNRLLGLELLRGAAALLVLLEHVRYSVAITCGRGVLLPEAIDRFKGYWGVDIFFVLSGYLIGLTLDRPGATARSFLLARLARILPLYLVASAFCLAVPMLRSYELSPAMIVTTLTLMPVAGGAMDPVTAHPYGWTLCYEMLFYLAATVLAAIFGPRRALPAMLGVFTLAPLLITATGPAAGWAYPNFALSPLTAEFALGLLAYRLTGSVPRRAGWAMLALGATGFVRGCQADGTCVLQSEVIADPLWAWTRVARFGLPAFACVLGTARLDRAGTFQPVARFATAVGAASYSLYLIQPFAFTLTALFGPPLGVDTPWPVAVATVVVTVAMGAFVARTIDLPLHALAKRYAGGLFAPASLRPAKSALTLPSMVSLTRR